MNLKQLLFRERIPWRLPPVSRVFACISLLALVSLSFVLGAADLFFQFPPSEYLHEAFTGAKAWSERGREPSAPTVWSEPNGEKTTLYKPEKTYDGFTLYTTTETTRARLIDMRGEVVHQWKMPFSVAWNKKPPHVRDAVADKHVHWFRCHLFPNGDLLAIYHTNVDTPYGYGLVKLDKDSKLLWAYPGRVHHDIDVADDGTLYALAHKLESKPPPGMEFVPGPYIADSIVVLSADGQERDSLPILEAFRDSPYALTLSLMMDNLKSTARPLPNVPAPTGSGTGAYSSSQLLAKGDIIHANSIRVLRPSLASKFPLFQSDQVLISLRNLDCLAVVDLKKRSVVWSARGPWREQHDVDFLDNGHLLLYDNAGSLKGCRVLEYDPVRQAVSWVYAGENSFAFKAIFRGTKQRLPNGNTLIVDPDHGRLFEVTADKELVWESYCPLFQSAITGAHRYGRDELPFLKGNKRVSP